MSDADKWPKSFRWPGKYLGHDDIVTFLHDDDTDRDLQGVEWTYQECADEPAGDVAYWEPTGEHRQKSPPAPSQDDVKAEVALQVSNARAKLRQCDRAGDDAIDEKVRSLNCAIDWLADAVERLAK